MKQEESNDRNGSVSIEAVFAALSSIYTGVFLIDLVNDSYVIIRAPESVRSLLNGIASAQQALNHAIQQTVTKEDALDIIAFVNLVTLSRRMETEKCINIDYHGTISGWVRGSFIEVARDQSGRLTQILYAYQVIDTEKRKELDHVKQLKDSYTLAEKENKEEKQSLENDKKTLTDDLNYQNNFTKIIMEQLDCGIIVYTVPGRTLLQINREALRICGWKDRAQAEENLTKHGEKIRFVDPEDEKKLLQLRDHEGAVKYQFIINAGQEDEKWVLAESKSLSGRYGGRVVMSTFMDITHITLLEEEKITLTDRNVFLKNENAQLQRAREAVYTILNSGSYIATYDRGKKQLQSIRYSDALRRLYGYEGTEDAPDSWEMWIKSIYPEDREYVERSYLSALADYSGATSYDVTFRAVKKDGTIRWHRAAADVIRWEDGSPDTCYGFVMDIDEQKKAADKIEEALTQARLANEAKTSFLARMSHDIRTPMNGIMGLIDINEKHAQDIEFTTQNRKKAKVAANHLLSLINDVLQLSKLEDSGIELSQTPFNMHRLMDDIFTIIEMRAKDNGITVNIENDPSVLQYPYLWGSPLHVRQLYINILSNAIKYNKKNGSILYHASVERLDPDHILSTVIIKDTGIGMSEEFQKHLFDPFAREHEEMTGRHEGTGLGMSIVKQLVDKMDGTIQVESKVGEGTCFTVQIPFRLASEADVRKTEEKPDVGDITGTNVLLVEDNELNMDIAEILLTDAGASITKAVNGQQAVDLFEKNEPGTFDVILMDVMMPVMNGYEATRRIRSLERADAKKIPVIAMTANAFAEDVEKAKQAGMNDHLSKPLDTAKMLATIAKFK